MLTIFTRRQLEHDEFVCLLKRASDRSLTGKLKAVVRQREQSDFFGRKEFDKAFEKLSELATNDSESVEAEILLRNIPPSLNERDFSIQMFWAEVLYVIVGLNHIFTDQFYVQLMRGCLTQPTPLGYALCHSTVLAALAEKHPKFLDNSLIEVVISSTEDSRAIYALKLARWLPDWSAIKSAVFTAMLSEQLLKQSEAMKVVHDRGGFDDVISFAEQNGIQIPTQIRESSNIYVITQLIAGRGEGQADPLSYVINLDGSQASPKLSKELSELIRKVLGDSGCPPRRK